MIERFIPIVYGRSKLFESMAFENGSKEKSLPIDFIVYYIKTKDRQILVDAGCDTMRGFEMRDFIGPVKALENFGIDKNDITDVLITHAHHDHIDGVRHFKNATVYIQKDEYERGKKHIPEGFKVHIFEEEFKLCDGITIVKIGGHSVGSCIVEVLYKNKKYVVCGDECYVRRCLDEKIPTGASFDPSKSREFIKTYSRPDYVTLLCHEYTNI